MASTIKGITVSIGGDTTNLKKSLDSVDKTSKDLQRELNLVNRELKFNPDSATLLAQKQEILAEKVNATREKLEKLNEEVLTFLLRAFIPLRDASDAREARPASQPNRNLQQMHGTDPSQLSTNGEQQSRKRPVSRYAPLSPVRHRRNRPYD